MCSKSSILIGLLLFALVLCTQGQEVVFSKAGGFYDNTFDLELRCDAGFLIRYTTNGSQPTGQSPLYTQPLSLNESLFSKSNIYTVVNCIPSVYHAVEDVEHAIVIRAAAFDELGNRVGPVATNTYCIDALGCDLHGLPVLSIAADSLDLFDYETGIFVPGANYDLADTTGSGNYNMTGREWERQINVEFYELDNSGINQQCGLRTHGGASRWYQQKGMRLYARDEYGKKRFKHAFFKTTPIANFKHLNLHPFRCSNWWQTGGQEYLSQCVAAKLDIDGLGVRQTVVFINGEYWGIYTLEESPDERYLEDHYDVDLDKVNVIKYWGVTNHGDGMDWWRFRNWIENADLNQPADSAYAFSRIDVPSFVDYFLLETYGANLDWPQNNVLQWQASNGEPFRMMFFDGDGCFTRWYYQALYNATHQAGSSLIINKLMGCEAFKSLLYERYIALKKSVFSVESLMDIWDGYRDLVEDEVPAQAERFGFPTSMQRWQADMDSVEVFFAKRAQTFGRELQDELSCAESVFHDVVVYPNPTNGVFFVGLEAETSVLVPVEIFNVMGQRVHSEVRFFISGHNAVRIETTLRPGLYLVKVGELSKRIVIQ